MKKLALALLVFAGVYGVCAVIVDLGQAQQKVSSVKSDIRVKSLLGSGGGLSLLIPTVQQDTSGAATGGSNVLYSLDFTIVSVPDTIIAFVATIPTFDGNSIQVIKEYSPLTTAATCPAVGARLGIHWDWPQGIRLARQSPQITLGWYRLSGDVVSTPAGANALHGMAAYRVERHWE